MLPAHLLLLQRIATPDEPDNLPVHLKKLRSWVEQARRNGKPRSLVQDQELLQQIIAAASRSLWKLAAILCLGKSGALRNPACGILNMLELCCAILRINASWLSADSADAKGSSYLEALRVQVRLTDIFSHIAAASSAIAEAINQHLQTSSSTACSDPTATAPDASNSSSSNSSKAGTARTSSKRLRGRSHRSRQEAAIWGPVAITDVNTLPDECLPLVLGYNLLSLWGVLQRCWFDEDSDADDSSPDALMSSSSATEQTSYHQSVMHLGVTIVPVSQLVLALMRFHSSCSNSIPDKMDIPACTMSALTTLNYTTDMIISLGEKFPSCTAAAQDIQRSQHYQEVMLVTAAINTYLLWKQRKGRTTLPTSLPLLADVTSILHAQDSVTQPKSRRQKQGQQQMMFFVDDHHLQLLEMLGLDRLSPDEFEQAGVDQHCLGATNKLAETNALSAANNLRRAFKLNCSLIVPRQWQQQVDLSMGDNHQYCFHPVVLSLLLELMVLASHRDAVLACAGCFNVVARNAKMMHQSSKVLSAADTAEVEQRILARIMLQGVPVMVHALQQDMDAKVREVLEEMIANMLGLSMLQDHLPADEQKKMWSYVVHGAPFPVMLACEVAVRIIGRSISMPNAVGRGLRFMIDAGAEHQRLQEAAGSSRESLNGCAAQLISVLCSCMKYCQPFIDIKALELAAAVASSAQAYAEACSSSTNSSLAYEVAVPWIHVVARALLYCGRALLQSAATGAVADSEETWQEDQAAAMSAAVRGTYSTSQRQDKRAATDTVDSQQERPCDGAQTTSIEELCETIFKRLGAPTDGWQCSDVSDLLQRLSDATGWCGKQLGQLQMACSSRSSSTSKSAATSDSVSRLQRQSKQLQEGLAAALGHWEGEVYDQMRQQFAGCDTDGSSWMMFVGARQVVGYKLADQLQQYAVDLCAVLPTTLCCNNPGCVNLSGVSELSCVGRRKCSRCQAAGYCSKECQTLHWGRHRAVCKHLIDESSS